jgi:phosphoribosylglycinamide formyltransferase-1
MTERFVSEAIRPVTVTCDTVRMAAGEPGLPGEFLWKDDIIRIAAVLRTWRETGSCRHGSSERYVRKHWYEIATTSGAVMKIYFERQARSKSKDFRWWLFSIDESGQTWTGLVPGICQPS